MPEIQFNHLIQNQKVLVTGGAGFIGSHLIDKLLEGGNEVVCLDNLSTGNQRNLTEAKKSPRFTFINGDIREPEVCRKAVKGAKYVFHQAALGSVPRSVDDPVTTNEVNVGGFVNMLTAAKDEGVKRFVYAASSSTYGNHSALPKTEDIIGQPLSPYAVSKYVNELYARVFGDVYDLKTIGLRYFNVFGERQDPNGAYAAVIPRFITSVIKGESPRINGDGTHSRDFTYVQNAVQANLLAASANTPDADNEIFNVAYGEATTLIQLVDIITQNLVPLLPQSNSISIQFGPERTGDIKHSLASIEKARKVLGYQPQYNIEEGLKRTINWYLKNT